MKPIHFQKADLSHFEEVWALFRAAVKNMDDHGIPQWDEIYPSYENIRDDITSGDSFVGLIEGRVAVFFVLNLEQDEQYFDGRWTVIDQPYIVLHRLCVHPDFQHQRVAKRTLFEIERILRERGIVAIRIDAFSRNPYALRLYEDFGFVRVGECDFRKGIFYLFEKIVPPDDCEPILQ